MLGRGFKGNTLRTWQMKTGPWSITNLVMNIKKKKTPQNLILNMKQKRIPCTFTHTLQGEVRGLVDVAGAVHQRGHAADQHSGAGVGEPSAVALAVVFPFI